MSAPGRFDLLGPLPEGTTVLEASAGTGKTFTIAALVARYVAEGVAAMDQLLVVSFSRDSTRELRERVREQLMSARDALRHPAEAAPGDELVAFLRDTDPAGLAVRCRRLDEAVASFDAATVTTTHGFCQQALLALGTAGDHDAGAVLIEGATDLVHEVADDLYLRKWGRVGAGPAALTGSAFHELAMDAVRDPGTRLLPDPAAVGGLPGQRASIAAAARDEVDRRKRRQHLLGFDDMLMRLAGSLTDPNSGPAARSRLRARYAVVLVDEFQDTDPVQWTILREAFHGHRTLVLIGDPKQAIYGFRGADVHTYLDAAKAASTTSTLPVNFRSDAGLLDGLRAVFRGAALGDPRIRVLPVTAAHLGRMVQVGGAPVQLRVLPRAGLTLAKNGTVTVDDARGAVARDLAGELVRLLSGGATVRPRDGGPERAVQPADVAVLVRTNNHAQQIRQCLEQAGVPVVVTGRTNVFGTDGAQEWQLLLEALEQPHRATRVRRLALGCFVGLRAADLDADGDSIADDLALRLRTWREVLEDRGVAALFEAVCLAEAVQPRVLARPGGERLMTDLRHIAQVLHETALVGRLGSTALVGWLRRRRDEAGTDSTLERSRRLDSDAAAVQVITVHTSKGLEFPVVMVPFGWDLWPGNVPATVVFHDPAGERLRDVGGSESPDWKSHTVQHKREEIDDELRLTYVALTRAQSHLLLWWAPSTNTPFAPLHRLLLNDDPTLVAPQSIPVPTTDEAALTVFANRAAASDGTLAVEVITARPPAVWSPATRPPTTTLAAAVFARSLDTAWRRTSYSALTAAAHDRQPPLGSEPELSPRDDESDSPDVGAAPARSAPGDALLRATASTWDTLGAGTQFGTLVHAVLEHLTDPADPGAVRAAVAEQAARHSPGTDVPALTAGLLVALSTPLGPLTGGAALRDVSPSDRLPELDFELPLAGGDEPHGRRLLLEDLVPLWREHCPTGPLSSYADVLAGLAPAPLRGYLTGSIDAVLRVGPPDRRRYVVVDYKTNRLGGYDDALTAWHYRPGALERAMIDAHYPLQALLYDVALHRYLRWRQPGYDPAVHLGGALYLFLRGMSGPDVTCDDGSRPGVFAWHAPTGLVTGLSDLLAGTR